jgi:hypothetical protein
MPDYGDLVSAVVAQNPGTTRPAAVALIAQRWPTIHAHWSQSLSPERVQRRLEDARDHGTLTETPETRAHARAVADAVAEIRRDDAPAQAAEPSTVSAPPAPAPSAAEHVDPKAFWRDVDRPATSAAKDFWASIAGARTEGAPPAPKAPSPAPESNSEHFDAKAFWRDVDRPTPGAAKDFWASIAATDREEGTA